MNIGNLTEARKRSPTFVADRLSQEDMEALIGKPLPETRGVSTTKETDIKYNPWHMRLIKNTGRFLYYLARA